jgi:hypothetical protein
MNKIVISKLISVANELDAMGDSVNADRLTNLADSYQAPLKEDIDERIEIFWRSVLKISIDEVAVFIVTPPTLI